jgi:predicted ATPase
MPVTPRPCRNCTLTADGTAIIGIVDASVNLTADTIEVTEITTVDRVHIGGMRSGTVSGTVFYDQADAGVIKLEALIKGGTAASLIFTLHSNATYTVPVIITSWSPSIAVNDVVRATFTGQFAGECVIA